MKLLPDREVWWRERRTMGRARFIATHGLTWGIVTGIVVTVILLFVPPGYRATGIDLGWFVVVSVLAWPLLGWLWGAFVWWEYRRRYG